MKNKQIFFLFIISVTQLLYAQKPMAKTITLTDSLFSNYINPISIALLKFDGDDQLDINLYKDMIKNPIVHKKFLIFPFKSIEKLIKIPNRQALTGQDSKLRKKMKKAFNISVILFGVRLTNGKIQLTLMDTESSKILFTSEYEESINSTIVADIVKLLLFDEKTIYQNIGSLDLILNPVDCVVQLNGNTISSRENIELAAGQHFLTVTKEGYYSKSDTVIIVSSQKTTHTMSLKEITGRVLITSEPLSSKTFRQGEKIIKKYETTVDTIDIKPGEYTIELDASGYKKKDRTISVEGGKVISMDISLEKEELPAKLSVSVNVKNSEIVIKDGEQIIKSFNGEIKDYSINKGKYKIIVSCNGYITQEKNIDLVSDQNLIEQFILLTDVVSTSTSSSIEISVSTLLASDAQIYLNNVLKGVAPLNIPLMPGYYNILARKSNYKDAIKNVTLQKNSKEKIIFTMEPIVSPYNQPKRTWNWVTTLLAVGGGAAAAYFYSDSKSNYDKYNVANSSTAKDLRAKTESSSKLFTISVSVSAVFLLTSIILWATN